MEKLVSKTTKPNSADSAGPSGLEAAVHDVATAFAVQDADTAGWTVVKPKGKQGNWAGGKRSQAGGPSTSIPHPVAADVPGVKLSKSQLKKRKRQQKILKRKLAVGESGPRPHKAEGGPMPNKAEDTTRATPRPNLQAVKNKQGPKPHAPLVDAVDLSAMTAGPAGSRGDGPRNNRFNRKKRAEIAISKAALAPAHKEPLKRIRLDDTVSPRGDRKKPKTENERRPPASYAEMVGNKLCVAVTRADNHQLTDEQATSIKNFITSRILAEAKTPTSPTPVVFLGKPIFGDGALKLWCEDEGTLTWLNAVVGSLPPETCPKLTVKRQSELSRKLRAVLVLPDCANSLEDTSLVLDYQNKWALVSQWTVYAHNKSADGALLLTLGIPEKVVPQLMSRGRRLAHNLGSVYVRFVAADGSLKDEPPAAEAKTPTANTTDGAKAPAQTEGAKVESQDAPPRTPPRSRKRQR